MDWISKLEKKWGRYAIDRLPVYIVIAYAIGFVLAVFSPSVYSNYLALDVGMILKGQVWRIITFIIQPPSTSLIFIIFALYLYYFIGTSLENAWGAFRFNLYFFAGVLFHVVGAFLAYFITYLTLGTGISFHLGTEYLNLSMFFAFAALFPDVRLLLFFIIPIKIKWLAYADGVFFLYAIISGIVSNSLFGYAAAIAAVVSLLNFMIFFLSSRKTQNYIYGKKRQAEYKRKEAQYKNVQYNKAASGNTAGNSRHSCSICHRTEISNPELDFRYCSKCSGAHEYCQDHLFTHNHIK